MRCSFKPYEGNKNYVFISYSHKDSKIVCEILEKLNEKGVRIWYDEGIEWGEEWPASIATHLKNCAVCVAFHSNSSALSMGCKQEINYALKEEKKIISVFLEDNVNLNAGTDMQLALFQSVFTFDYNDFDEFIGHLSNSTILLNCCKKQKKDKKKRNIEMASFEEEERIYLCGGYPSTGDINENDVFNIDDELIDKFDELFGSTHGNQKKSEIKEKIGEIKANNFVKKFENSIEENENINKLEGIIFDSMISLVPIEYYNSNGKHFSIYNLPNVKTIVFEIYKCISYKSFSQYYICKPLECETISYGEKERTETIFYIEDPQTDGNQLCFLHFEMGSTDLYLNSGILYGDVVKISRNPTYFKMSKSVVSDELKLCSSAYDLTSLTEDALIKNSESDHAVWVEARLNEAPAIIIDPDTVEPVLRKVFYDTNSNELKAKIKIFPNKAYFVFRIQTSKGLYRPLTDMEIADYYSEGKCGFPKDIMEAVSYYEEDGSSDALYKIAVLFRTESDISNEQIYIEYLEKSVKLKCEKAITEYALYLYRKKYIDIHKKIKNLFEGIKNEKMSVAYYAYAYLLEIEIIGYPNEQAFEYYYKAALNSYKPAIARLCCNEKDLESKKEIFEYYLKNSESWRGISNYGMACVLFFGYNISSNKRFGLELFIRAAEAGNELAVRALFEIYDNDSEYKNEEEALKWLKEVEKFDSTVINELVNRLLDGIGCENNGENDLLAHQLLKKAVEFGNKTALHNLGWTYKMGRGCVVDYLLALDLFKKAGRANSFYQMGDMYEKGLGVIADKEKAIEFYKLGKQKGSKKAAERLKEMEEKEIKE